MMYPVGFFKPPTAAPPSGITLGRSNSTYRNGTGGSYTIGWANGVAAANGVWLVAVVEESTNSGTHPYISGGSAWTRIGTTKCYYKQCGPSEPTTYNVSWYGQSKTEGSAVAILEVIGASSVESVNSASSTPTAPSVTSTDAGDLVVIPVGGVSVMTPPSGYTLQTSASGNASAGIATKLNVGVGTINPGNWGGTAVKTYSLAFKP